MLNRQWFLLLMVPLGLAITHGCSRPASTVVTQAPTSAPAESKSDSANATPPTDENAGEETAAEGNADKPMSGRSGSLSAAISPPKPEDSTTTSDNDPNGNNSDEAESAESSSESASPGMLNRVPKTASDNNNDSEEHSGAAEDAPELPEFPGPSGKTGTNVGDLIPEIKGKDVDKKSFKLSDYSGKVVMLDFWGDW